MISVIIPTRNRKASLARVLPSYASCSLVAEIIIVDDASDLPLLDTDFAFGHECLLRIARNETRCGAAAARNFGVSLAKSKYVFFGEDDAYLDDGYLEKLIAAFSRRDNLAIVSGQIVYLRPEESSVAARQRFNSVTAKDNNFDPVTLTLDAGVRLSKPVCVPMTHALFMSTRKLLETLKFDEEFKFGNGYREESTFQARCFAAGYDTLVIPDCYCFHYHKRDVPTGGQRTNHWLRIYSIWINNYRFLKKYYPPMAGRLGGVRNIYLMQVRFMARFLCQAYFLPLVRKLIK